MLTYPGLNKLPGAISLPADAVFPGPGATKDFHVLAHSVLSAGLLDRHQVQALVATYNDYLLFKANIEE